MSSSHREAPQVPPKFESSSFFRKHFAQRNQVDGYVANTNHVPNQRHRAANNSSVPVHGDIFEGLEGSFHFDSAWELNLIQRLEESIREGEQRRKNAQLHAEQQKKELAKFDEWPSSFSEEPKVSSHQKQNSNGRPSNGDVANPAPRKRTPSFGPPVGNDGPSPAFAATAYGYSSDHSFNKNTNAPHIPTPMAGEEFNLQLSYMKLLDLGFSASDTGFVIEITQGNFDESLRWVQALQRLRDMGFNDEQKIRGALLVNEGNVNRAFEELSGEPNS
eukprot:CAMPEP_0117451968 /NCGR_PEP_ID=MMETSP0759-20121206/9317_1 /TAXON_ID=63605 /ORGANISM="Percolomonas cosmopolitus, Strain WS" /LENGTH=274 /DNA_ID=CAMNT_0005244657 /DNA_START=237 /DNA_END=1061 /DNA_ORIENTATION=-